MKIALVHDFLCGIGGSERVFKYICNAFPQADIFTVAYNPNQTFPSFQEKHIKTTWLNRYVQTSEAFRWSFVLGTYAMEQLDLSSYDLVISSSATTAKYVKAPQGIHICYCYMPTRALWHFDAYFEKSLKAALVRPLLPFLKKRDYKAAKRVDYFIAISESSKNYIKQYYDRDADVLMCPIETDKFYAAHQRKDYYLLVSRLEHWKRVDYAIEAFNELGLPLHVIGKGAEEAKLKKMAKENIHFLGEVDDKALSKAYSECKAVVFTPFLEYGLIPLEANASGAPVIAYGKGGIEETMVPLGVEGKKATAVFFYEQTASSLTKAVKEFEKQSFEAKDLIDHAAKWSVSSFQNAFKDKILSYVEKIKKNHSLVESGR